MTEPTTPVDESAAVTPEQAVSTESGLGVATTAERVGSLWSDAWYELRRNPLFIISALMLVVLIAMAIWPSLFTHVNPYAPDACKLQNKLMPPSGSAIFGYDDQGCSIYPRVIYGARASILVGVLVTLFTTLIGGTVGAIAGYAGGWIDSLLSRITDVFFALPLVLGSLVILSAFTFKYVWGVVLALTLLGWVTTARIMRSAVISTKNADYVTAARALGASPLRIMRRHILPNALAPVIVVATISLGVYIATEATLSFLGIGLKPPTISWGQDISDALTWAQDSPHALLFPAGFLSITVLSFILLGEAVRDALDPKLR